MTSTREGTKKQPINAATPPRVHKQGTTASSSQSPATAGIAKSNRSKDLSTHNQQESKHVDRSSTTPNARATHSKGTNAVSSSQPFSQSLSDVPNAFRTNPRAADTYNRQLSKARPRPLSRELSLDESVSVTALQSNGVNRAMALTSGIMYQQRISQFIEGEQESSARKRHVPPLPDRQDLYCINEYLSIVMRIKNSEEFADYWDFKTALKKSNAGKGKGKEVDRTPRDAFARSPLRTIISEESLETLIGDHEDEIDIETQRYRYEDKSTKAEGEWRKLVFLVNIKDPTNRVFGMPLAHVQKFATQYFSVNDYQQELPLVVYNCVERLLTGASQENLFRCQSDFRRVDKLTEEFDTGPDYRRHRNLSQEQLGNVCALLRRYLKALPHSILGEHIYSALLKWCVLPTFKGTIMPFSMTSTLGRNTYASDPMERLRIETARMLLRLMPLSHLSLFTYLCGFFVLLNMSCEQNFLDMHSIASMFADPLVYKEDKSHHEQDKAPTVLMWILERFNTILVGLYDIEADPMSMRVHLFGKEDLAEPIENSPLVATSEQKDKSEEMATVTESLPAVESASPESLASTSPDVSGLSSLSDLSLSDNPHSSASSLSLSRTGSAVNIYDESSPTDINPETTKAEETADSISTDAPCDNTSSKSGNDVSPYTCPTLQKPIPAYISSKNSVSRTASTATTTEATGFAFSESYKGVQSTNTSLSVPDPPKKLLKSSKKSELDTLLERNVSSLSWRTTKLQAKLGGR